MALKTLYSFSNHTGWPEVDQMFRDELAKVYETLASSPDEATLRQMQGRAQFIREFLDLVANAAKVLEKLRESSL